MEETGSVTDQTLAHPFGAVTSRCPCAGNLPNTGPNRRLCKVDQAMRFSHTVYGLRFPMDGHI